MALFWLFDVRGDERRPTPERRTLRIDLEPEFRGTAGAKRTHASHEPRNGGSRGGVRETRGRPDPQGAAEPGVTPFTKVRSVAAPFLETDIDTDIIFPARFLLLLDRRGLGAHLFHAR